MITIIGAGAAGNYAAYLLAKQGFDVQVFEANSSIGKPVACTGILTSHFDTLIEMKKELIANEISSSRIVSPDGSAVKINFRKPNKILHRHMLDQHVARMAIEEGAKYYTSHVYLENRNGKARIRNLKTEEEFETEYSMLIGADGPASKVAKNNGMYGNRTLYLGLQATAKHDNDNVIDFYPGEQGIAWVVPESGSTVRIGVASTTGISDYFNTFCKKIMGEEYSEKIIEKQAGPIPLYKPDIKTSKEDVYLVGDSATMVKATTLGGVMQSHLAAKALARSIIERKDYENEWRKVIGRDLWLHLMMRKAMDKFKEKDYNYLVNIFKKDSNRKILEENDRDFPTKFMLKLALSEPGLALFSRFLI
ncbi:NAD(P)/FAD-dependent oxidoreductase [Candidatus Woesearchaeota archaeon]|nr:NAD(P)/FAD-dependent oxidoreductase [Candidatus Woesearchaeota archaeon]